LQPGEQLPIEQELATHAICEATTGIFVWSASGLYDTIKGHEFEYNTFSHDLCALTSGDLWC
jgi:hypothetical protein